MSRANKITTENNVREQNEKNVCGTKSHMNEMRFKCFTSLK